MEVKKRTHYKLFDFRESSQQEEFPFNIFYDLIPLEICLALTSSDEDGNTNCQRKCQKGEEAGRRKKKREKEKVKKKV